MGVSRSSSSNSLTLVSGEGGVHRETSSPLVSVTAGKVPAGGSATHGSMTDSSSGSEIDASSVKKAELAVSTNKKETPTPEMIETIRNTCDPALMLWDQKGFNEAMNERAHALVSEKYGAGNITARNQFDRCYNQAVREFLVEKGFCPPSVAILSTFQSQSDSIKEKIDFYQASVDATLAAAFTGSFKEAYIQACEVRGQGPNAVAVRFRNFVDHALNRERSDFNKPRRSFVNEIQVRFPFSSKSRQPGVDSWFRPNLFRDRTSYDEHGAAKISQSSSVLFPFEPINHCYNNDLAHGLITPLRQVLSTIGEAANSLHSLIAEDADAAAHTLVTLPEEGDNRKFLNQAFEFGRARDARFQQHLADRNIDSAKALVNYVHAAKDMDISNEEQQVVSSMLGTLVNVVDVLSKIDPNPDSAGAKVSNLLQRLASPQTNSACANEALKVAKGYDEHASLYRLAHLLQGGRVDTTSVPEVQKWIHGVRHLDEYLPVDDGVPIPKPAAE